ncbi:MAG: ZIP family metal transporter [Candidatus Hadarchaeaceae archaeon]
MMIVISFVELIPQGLKHASLFFIAISFFAGAVIMRIVDHLLPHVNPELIKKEKPSVKRSVIMLVIGIALHNIPEGLAIGVGFAITAKLGITIALAIAIQDIPENIATIVPLYGMIKKKAKSFVILITTVLFEVAGFLLGYLVLRGLSLSWLGVSLALAAGFMVYISVEELIPSAQVKRYPKMAAAAMVLGAMTVLLTSLV